MFKSEWIATCAARYIERGGLSQDEATEAALNCWDGLGVNDDDEIAAGPQDYADDDMDCWTDDGEV